MVKTKNTTAERSANIDTDRLVVQLPTQEKRNMGRAMIVPCNRSRGRSLNAYTLNMSTTVKDTARNNRIFGIEAKNGASAKYTSREINRNKNRSLWNRSISTFTPVALCVWQARNPAAVNSLSSGA